MRACAVFGLLLSTANLFAAPAPVASAPASVAPVTFENTIRPLLEKYCYDCHGNGEHKGDLKLDAYQTTADVAKDANTWEIVLGKLRHHEMPPDDADDQPTVPERDFMIAWIEKQIYRYDASNPDPGHVTLHRLNRAEYNNSIRDLTGIDFKPADDFPADDSGYGFDNNGDVLSLPPMLLEKYLAASDKILDQAIATDPIPRRTEHIPANFAEVGFNAIGDRGDGWVRLISLEEDDVTVERNIAAPGDYLVRFQAFGEQSGGAMAGAGDNSYLKNPGPPAPPILSIRLGDTKIKEFTVTADEAHPGVYEARVGVPAGPARFRVVMDRLRGGDYELIMTNGKIGKQQNGIGYVKWIEIEGPLDGATTRTPASLTQISGDGYFTPATTRVLTGAGNVSIKFAAPHAGDFLLRVYGYAMQAGSDPVRLAVSVDGHPLQTFDVLAPARLAPLPKQNLFSLTLLHSVPQVYEVRVPLSPGDHQFSAAFVNPFDDPKNDNPNLRQRNLVIQSLEVVDLSAPARLPEMPPVIQQYFKTIPAPANQAAAARDAITAFARRAWRRPPPPVEVNRLMQLYELSQQQGDSYQASVKLAMKAVLISPHFLFREDAPEPPAFLADELHPPAAITPAPAGFVENVEALFSPSSSAFANVPASLPAQSNPPSLGVPIDEFSLASRLSYFLWSSTPDDELLDLAQHNQLRANLDYQVRRMLASPKSSALVDNFAGQWLQFRSLPTFEPDKTLFPDFTPALRNDMEKETATFFDYVMRQDRSVMDFLTANYTFANAELAKFYGFRGVSGDDFQKVSLEGTPRRGVLTQGSVLLLTSNPTRTSPVKRGKWVLENLLGTPPPPPPPNVPVLDEEHQLTGTLRQQMEQHRANPTCASCHARMDPIGFSLENFDAVGALRDKDGNLAIDTSGQLVTGESFHGSVELVQLLAVKKQDDFLHCLADKMLTYALGRGLEYYDRTATDQIVQRLQNNNDKFSALVLGVVHSVPFQEMRRTEAARYFAPPAPPASAQKVADN
jgi:hypothetical protein